MSTEPITDTTITDTTITAAAQRRHGSGWSAMDAEQRAAALATTRERMILAAYPTLAAELEQAHADRDQAHGLLHATAAGLHMPAGAPITGIPAAAAAIHEAARNLQQQLDRALARIRKLEQILVTAAPNADHAHRQIRAIHQLTEPYRNVTNLGQLVQASRIPAQILAILDDDQDAAEASVPPARAQELA